MVSNAPSSFTVNQGASGYSVTVNEDDTLDADFGFVATGSVGDQTYLDNDRDGIFSGSDDTLGGVTVDLHEGACPANLASLGTELEQTTSDGSGLYLFERVVDGTYCVVAANPGTGEELQGSTGHTVVVSGGAALAADFGYAPVGSLGDLAYIDANNNGAYNASNDLVLSGVVVSLYDRTCPADLTTMSGSMAQTTTNEAGFYQFSQLPADTYCVVATVPNWFSISQGSTGHEIVIDAVSYTHLTLPTKA